MIIMFLSVKVLLGVGTKPGVGHGLGHGVDHGVDHGLPVGNFPKNPKSNQMEIKNQNKRMKP